MALEISRPGTDVRPEDQERIKEAEGRALRALESLLGRNGPEPDVASAPADEDDDIVDIRDGAEPQDTDSAIWVTVRQAAARAGVSTSTVRQWYRSGNLATQRREGDRGAFLVPLVDVVRLAAQADEAGDVAADSVIDINAAYWAGETEAARAAEAEARAEADEARAEARRLTADLDDARAQIESAREQLRSARGDTAAAERAAADAAAEAAREVTLLREQLAEANDEVRTLRERVSQLESALAVARRAATFGSVTSTEWVEEVEHGYRGPLRPQGAELLEDVADEAYALPQYEVPSYEVPQHDEEAHADDADLLDEQVAEPVHIVFGEAADDLLPEPESKQKGRRTRR
ncbi:MAG TPA: hypothetical protein VM345_17240 [Acidimicrobiales bacterium]|jgi:hypothetical protein|nr:hypothetical protein [Acidimicrobiales bacterium]